MYPISSYPMLRSLVLNPHPITEKNLELTRRTHRTEDFKAALSEPGLMIVDAYATWCGPCKMIAPKIVEFSKQYSDARFYKVDVDELPDVAQELGIRAMPTFKFFKDGEEVQSVMGANPQAIEAAIQEGLSSGEKKAEEKI